ncbi:hypothetical protein BZA77DRAFT_136528 [Pyronema omphalodes]|nr:hypothetical protein BZA77DRAFT_136528 [Pyronema omphalodes]
MYVSVCLYLTVGYVCSGNQLQRCRARPRMLRAEGGSSKSVARVQEIFERKGQFKVSRASKNCVGKRRGVTSRFAKGLVVASELLDWKYSICARKCESDWVKNCKRLGWIVVVVDCGGGGCGGCGGVCAGWLIQLSSLLEMSVFLSVFLLRSRGAFFRASEATTI